MFVSIAGNQRFTFDTLKEVLAKASPLRSGDVLAGVAAPNATVRIAAQRALADIPLKRFLLEPIIAFDTDEITRSIYQTHNKKAFESISHYTVGQLRNWLLDYQTGTAEIELIRDGLTPEMVAAVSKIMSNQDLIQVASKIRVVTRFNNTIGLAGTFSSRLQPNHPTDSVTGIAASIIDGLMHGIGDAVIGINPATDNLQQTEVLLRMLDNLIKTFQIPTQACVLTHITNTLTLIEKGVPVDLAFQSIAGTEQANASFGISLSILREAHQATLAQHRGQLGKQVMYFETGQGSALSANAHMGIDQQTCEVRAYAVAKLFDPLLVNTVVGFIGPEYLYDGKQIIRAGLEDHFCGKLMGLPMGCDICYTNHAEADQDDMDVLLTLLATAGCNFIMGVPGTDDIMLHYQSTSFNDIAFVRSVLGLKPAPEFEQWLLNRGIINTQNQLVQSSQTLQQLQHALLKTEH